MRIVLGIVLCVVIAAILWRPESRAVGLLVCLAVGLLWILIFTAGCVPRSLPTRLPQNLLIYRQQLGRSDESLSDAIVRSIVGTLWGRQYIKGEIGHLNPIALGVMDQPDHAGFAARDEIAGNLSIHCEQDGLRLGAHDQTRRGWVPHHYSAAWRLR